MLARLLALALLVMATGPAHADEVPGEFDYWMLSLSWSPQYCAEQESDPQCVRRYSFVVHGLWPQYEDGFPDFCGGGRVELPLVERMLPLMPSEKLVQHEWRKHGTCSGMPQDEYFLTVERDYRAVAIPSAYGETDQYLQTSQDEIEKEFIAVNPGLTPKGIAVQCAGRWLKEVRVCFDKEFNTRDCGIDVEDRCGEKVIIRPVRKPGGMHKW